MVFDPIQLADDSERILRQADDLTKKQTVLGEYRTKQAAELANNLNIEFERSKRQRDENYRRRAQQLEINYKIKKAEGDQALAAATQQANLNEGFKREEDARKMRAIGDAFKAAGQIGSAVVKDQINQAQQQGADALKDQQTKSANAVNPVLKAESPPDSEILGQKVRDSITDTVTVSQANEQRLEESESDGGTGGREFNMLQRMFGVESAYNQAYTKQSNQDCW